MSSSKTRRRSTPTHDEDPVYGALRNKVGINLTDAEEQALRFLTNKEPTYVPGSKRRMGAGGIARMLMLESPRYRRILGLPPLDDER